MKKKVLSVTLVLGSLIFLAYIFFVSAADAVKETTLNGTDTDGYFGYSVASGDVNGDGYDDVIVGASETDSSGGSKTGQAFVFFGTANGIDDMDATYANITINGTAAGDEFGTSVASGDVNNDSYADIIVGAWYADPSGAADAGQAYVFFGADYTTSINENASLYANITLNGTIAGDYFGFSVARGDVNNDSYSDVIVGAYSAYTQDGAGIGQAYVFFGADFGIVHPRQNASEYANITFNGTTDGIFAYSVASGDINNDNYMDVIVGAYRTHPAGIPYAGQAFVFFGADYTTSVGYNAESSANITLNGTAEGDRFGYPVGSGDINNDGYADVIVGATQSEVGGATIGKAYVFFGADYASAINEDASLYANISLNGTDANDYFGTSVAGGDVNNDGYADVIVSALLADTELGIFRGQAYICFGADFGIVHPSQNALGYANITINNTGGSLDYFGQSVASGDVNNDSYADIIIGSYRAHAPPGNDDEGLVFIYSYDNPVVNLDSPIDFYNETAIGSIVFNYTANDTRLDTCELYGNWSDGWHLNETFVSPSSDVTNGSSNITIEDGIYVWNVWCNDTAGHSAFNETNFTLTVDVSTAPIVSLDSPADFANFSTALDFNYTVSDLTEVDTCELWGNWSGGWHLNETFVGVTKDVANGSSVVDLEDGLYVWSVYCNDTQGSSNTAVENRTLTVDLASPSVTLDVPSDNSYDPEGDVNFSFTAVETHPDQCNLWFKSNATNWAQNDSTTYSNSVQANIFVNLTDAVYTWNVECNDTLNNPAFASANRTLIVDTTQPLTPTVTEPTDTSINPRDSISYTCGSSDVTAGISKWTWTLTKPQSGGTITKTGDAVTSDTQSFSGDDDNLAGTYTVSCEAEDKAGHKSSSSSTFTVYFSHATGEGAGAGPSAAAQLDLSTEEEITITEKQGTIQTFTLDGTTVHIIKIKKVDEAAGTVTIVIEPDPITITLTIGETEEVDIDADGTNDISVTLNSIKNGVADITTKRLTPLPTKEVPAEEIQPTEAPEEEVTPPEAASKAWLWILIIVILAVIGVGYWFIQKKKKQF